MQEQRLTKEKQAGADFIKVYSLLPRELYFAIAAEAKKLSIPLVGHVPEAVSAEEASDAGQRTFEHLIGILPACSSREKELLLAEACMVNGDKQLAIANYQKSLQLDPANTNAVEMLKKLTAP